MAADPKEQEEMKTILFTNLQILGMDVADKEEIYKIPFNADMFNLPNKAGAEMVLYFLFSKLNPALCKEQFRDCWPVLDRKSEIQFRKICTNWLISIQKGEAESRMPHVNTALLLSPGGRKFIHLMYSFSTYVLTQVMKSEYGWEAQNSIICPVINQRSEALDSVVSSAIQDSLTRERNKFFEYGHLTVNANRQWTHYTNALVKEYRGLRKANRDLELEKRQKVTLVADSCLKQDLSLPAKRTTTMFDTDQNIFAARLGERMKMAISHWSTLTKFSEFMTDKREIFQSILDNTTAKYTIDGTDMGVRVPGLLLRECSKEIQKQEIDNIYNGGALNLVSLVQLWNICLNMYKEHFQSETLPSVSTQVPLITAQAHKHHSHLKDVQELSEKMRDHTLPSLRRSIAKMQQKLNRQGVSTDSADNKTNMLGLILTAPTPPTETAAARTVSRVRETPPGPLAGPAAHGENTPDALQKVHNKVEMTVQSDSEVYHDFMNAPALSRLKIPQGSVNKRSENVQSSKTQLKPEIHLKSGRPQNSSRKIAVKNNLQPGLGRSLPVQNAASQQPTQKISGKPMESSYYSTTPRTSREKAVDLLADSIVDSVLNSSDVAVLSDMSVDNLLEFGDLGAEAFQSRSLIKRSPVTEKTKSLQNQEKLQTTGSFRPKTFSDHYSRADALHNQTSVYNTKPSETSVHHESIFSQNSKDADSSFGSVTEFDWSNNATMAEATWLPTADKWRSTKHSSHNSFLDKTADVFQHTETNVKTGVTTQFVGPVTPEQALPSGLKNSFDNAHSSDFLEAFSGLAALEKAAMTQLESGLQQRSNTSHLVHSFRDPSLHSSRLEETHDDHKLITALTETQDHSSPSGLSQNNRLTGEETACGSTPSMKSDVPDRITGFNCQNIPNRLPGDGQASSAQAMHPVSAGSDSETEAEQVFDNSRLVSLSEAEQVFDNSRLVSLSEAEQVFDSSRLVSLSPFIPDLSTSDSLTASIYNRLKNGQNHGHTVVSSSPNVNNGQNHGHTVVSSSPNVKNDQNHGHTVVSGSSNVKNGQNHGHNVVSGSPNVKNDQNHGYTVVSGSPNVKNGQNYGHCVACVSPNILNLKRDTNSEMILQLQQEPQLVSYSQARDVDLLGEQIVETTFNDSSVIDYSRASEDRLFDLETTNAPALVSLHSDEEDFESEQALNDSYIPFKEGIHLNSRSPAKPDLTPLKVVPQSVTGNPELSSRAEPITVSSKLALLQQKALSILNSSCTEQSSLAGQKQFNVETTNSRRLKDAGLINASKDEDADILSTELINTDLLAGLEDLVSL